ncbi:MepB family protein [Corynebacterium flavescens]
MGFSALELWASEVGLVVSARAEEHTSDYESGVAQIAGCEWHIRTARNTPSKPGAFVAFWCRGVDGRTRPFSGDEMNSGLMVFVEQQGRRGVFAFTPEHLEQLGITFGSNQPGKRGFRAYPAWCEDLNSRAKETQRAQASAFKEY